MPSAKAEMRNQGWECEVRTSKFALRTFPFQGSEQQLQSKLNVSGTLGRQYPPECGRPHEIIRQIKVWMIEEIEELRPELQIEPLIKLRVLQERGIYTL